MINIEDIKVLAVDDNSAILDLLWNKLKEAGLKADNWIPCSNLIDAKYEFDNNCIQYCIVDLELPRGSHSQISEVKNGVEFIEYICNQRKIDNLNCSYTILSGLIPNTNWLKLISVNNDSVIQKDEEFVDKVILQIKKNLRSGYTHKSHYSFSDILKTRIEKVSNDSIKDNLRLICKKIEGEYPGNIFTEINEKIIKDLKNHFVVKYKDNIELIKKNIKLIHPDEWDLPSYMRNKELFKFNLLAGKYHNKLCDYETSRYCIISPKIMFYLNEFNTIRNQEEHGKDVKKNEAHKHIFNSYFAEDGMIYKNLNEKNIYDNTLAILLILPFLDFYIQDIRE